MSRPSSIRVAGDDGANGVHGPGSSRMGWEVTDSVRRSAKDMVSRTPRSQDLPAYTPRRSGRFDQLGVLSTLNSAPPLPSPALTPRNGAESMQQRGDISVLATPLHPIPGATHQLSPDNNRSSMALDRSSWLPSPRQSFRFQQGVDLSVLDGSVLAKNQVLDTQEPDFISKLENSLIQKRDGDTSVRNSILPGFGFDMPASTLNVLKEGDSELGDLEAEIERVQREGAMRSAVPLPAAQDMEVEEVWEALMLWCGAHDDTLNQSQIEMLGHGLDVWRVEGFRPVLQQRNAPFCSGDVYLILNRVDDRAGAIGAVDEAYHMRRSRVKTLWTMHFWIGRDAHPLKAGVAAVLAKELCKVLKRHARPIREVEGEESEMLRSIFPKGIKAVPGACPHGFRHVEHLPRAPRLLRVQQARGSVALHAAAPVCTLVPLEVGSMHAEGCYVLDTEEAIFVYAGGKAPQVVLGTATQLAMGIHFREHSGRTPCPVLSVNRGVEPPEVEAAFWGHFGVHGKEEVRVAQAQARRTRADEEADVDFVLYRVDDLQDELEVTELQKGGLLRRAVLERGACLVLDLHSTVVVWKGKGATLDARNVGLQVARDLARPREQADGARERPCPVVVLPSDSDDVLFMSKFADMQWVVYADLAGRGRVSSLTIKAKDTSVRKMHSVTVRSWLETGQAVREHNKSAMFVQQGVLSGLKAWSVDNFTLSAVTSEMVGHFVMDRSYLIQCTYRTEGMVDRHIIYFWQGWNCSRVESLVWQYDISALMSTQIEKQTGSKPLQVRVQQGKEPAHLLALFDGSMVIHKTLSSLPPSASARFMAEREGGEGNEGEGVKSRGGLKENKGRGRLYAIAGTHPSRAYSMQVEAAAGSLNSNTCYLLYTAAGAVFLWLGHWADMQQRAIAAHVASRHEQSADGAFRVLTVHERQEPREFWEALGVAGPDGTEYVCAGYLREVGWWRPRLFGCKAIAQALRVREVFDFVQGDLRHHKAMLLDNYNEMFMWVGPQCNAVVQRMALELARDYIAHAPDGRNKDLQVTVVTFNNEPEAFRAHFPYWLCWPPTVGDKADNVALRVRTAAQKVSRAHGVSPSVLRQALHMLNKVPTRQRNALDLIVWKNHERAKWLRWGARSAGCSPFHNTFFQKKKEIVEENAEGA